MNSLSVARLFSLPMVLAFVLSAISQYSYAQGTAAPLPAPASAPSNDGSAIDQGIAYVLLLVALAITYLVH